MRVLLDTGVLIVAATAGLHALSPRARKILSDEKSERLLSTISITEMFVKANIGKLEINDRTIMTAVSDMKLNVLPYTAAHAFRLFDLPLHHREPFDRMLIATALAEKSWIANSGLQPD